MQRHARRTRLVAAGLSVGALVGLVTGMVATERVSGAPVVSGQAGVPAADPFATGGAATPPSTSPAGRVAHTVTGAS